MVEPKGRLSNPHIRDVLAHADPAIGGNVEPKSSTSLRRPPKRRRNEWIEAGIFTRLEQLARDGYDCLAPPWTPSTGSARYPRA